MLTKEEIKQIINNKLYEKGIINDEIYEKCSKPHITSLPYDNRTNDPTKLQKKIKKIFNRLIIFAPAYTQARTIKHQLRQFNFTQILGRQRLCRAFHKPFHFRARLLYGYVRSSAANAPPGATHPLD